MARNLFGMIPGWKPVVSPVFSHVVGSWLPNCVASPSAALWTAAHHRIPALFVVVNNRTYGKDRLHQQTMAQLRGRPALEPSPGIDLDDPPVDFAQLASAQGVEGIGPVSDRAELPKALARAFSTVRDERRSVLIDVVTDRDA